VLDGDVVDVDLVALDEIEQKVEGAFENFELHFIFVGHGREVKRRAA
jgi:hypothetical protein